MAVLVSVYSPQPDTSLHSETTNTRLVRHVECPLMPALAGTKSYWLVREALTYLLTWV